MTESQVISSDYGAALPGWARASLKRLPLELQRALEVTRKGRPRVARRLVWAAHFIDSLDATQAAVVAGYPKHRALRAGQQLRSDLAPIIDRAMPYIRVQLFPLAIKRQREILERGYDPDRTVTKTRTFKDGSKEVWEEADPNFAGPMAAQTVLKAAEQVLKYDHRAPENVERSRSWRDLLDMLVDDMGVDAVRQLKMVRERPDFREYLDERHGALKEVGP